MWKGLTLAVAMLVIGGLFFATHQLANTADEKPEQVLARANKLFDDKNYAEAAKAYEDFLAVKPLPEGWQHASDRVVQSKLRLRLFDDALAASQSYIDRAKDTPFEARAQRLAGNLYTLVPHWGTRSGGKFHRAQHLQGIRVRTERYDKKHALFHLEKARELYAKFEADAKALEVLPEAERKNWRNERIECIFDLASANAQFGIFENNHSYWFRFWAQRDDYMAETAGEEDFDEQTSDWQLHRKRPIGLRLSSDGKPIFATLPRSYGGNDETKVLYLLNEARSLDQTDNKKYTGLAWYRQAMLGRAQFGMDRLNQYGSMYFDGGKYPIQEELATINPWEMKDNETVLLAGGQVIKDTLPKDWDVIGILRTVVEDYAQSGIADEAHYALGLYHQSRQQYTTALKEYEQVKTRYEKSPWIEQADQQINRILEKQVLISNSSVQLPGAPVELQVSYRNTKKLWFVARRVDHEGFMRRVRDEKEDPRQGFRGFWALGNWHANFVNGYHPQNWAQGIAAEFIGDEVIRWEQEVPDDGSHRYAHAIQTAPIKDSGAYLVYAYLSEPPKDHADKKGKDAMVLGSSRAIFAMTDVAIVEKKVKEGNLYMITEARGGVPIVGADIEALEVWQTYNRLTRQTQFHRFLHKLKTDKDGLAVVVSRGRQHGSQLHALVKAGGAESKRFAWTGMSYWSNYHPSQLRSGMTAYTITDRPVYRPAQNVRYKIWLRQFNNGVIENRPDRKLAVTIYDPRGNKVQETTLQTDQFGGADSQFTLGEEATLGAYRIDIRDINNPNQHVFAGGQTFSVEEYKKPEYEVTVEPGKDHTKLGDKVEANIKATYYFGGPVSQGTVSYKVFRQEYTHNYFAPGRWDWLYGSGYGYSYYGFDYLPWWGQMRGCYPIPIWWGNHGNPVRELVAQGEAALSADGTVKVMIDTTQAAKDHPDKDHQYIIEAEVKDSSRRVITGEGSIKVTRQAYYSFLTADRGYYRPGQEIFLNVQALTPDNKPVKTEGILKVTEVVFGGPNNARIEETVLHTEKVALDESGQAKVQFRWEKSGQLKFTLTSPDQWGGQVNSIAMVWVVGRDFDGALYRFNDLELITDKRTYEPGETAHVMINTKHSNSYVLFADDVDNNHMLSYRVIHLKGKTTVVDIPIKANHAPNFFVEATTVNATRVHTQSKQMLVPPASSVIDVTVTTDKPEYKPGETATVNVTARTIDGKPAKAQFTLSGFDRSVLYISPETTPEIAKFFHGQVRHHHPLVQTNLVEQFSTAGHVHRPFQQLWPLPHGWYGIWGPSVGDWASISDEEINRLHGETKQWFDEQKEARKQNDGGGGFAQYGNTRGRMMALSDGAPGGPPMAATAAPMAKGMAADAAMESAAFAPAGGEAGGSDGASPGAEPTMRTAFADTALWLTTLTTDETGKATASFVMPDNLTTWKINGWATTAQTRVGQSSTMAVATKKLLVRLQAPRFFMEYDEVVLSANVNNNLSSAKNVTVSIDIPEANLQLIGPAKAQQVVLVQPGGEARVDWRVRVLKEGVAAVAVKAITDEESDAMTMSFPVLVHGMSKQVAMTGSMRPDENNKTHSIEINIPDERRPELTRLEIQFAPSLVGSMLDALPYLLYYPYESSENTVSRFMPAVLTLKTLQNMGINLEEIRNINKGRMEEIRRVEQGERRTIYGDNAIFDSAEMQRIIDKGRTKIINMQNGDGGWGWWPGGESSPYFTVYILHALVTAQLSDVEISNDVVMRGMNFLQNWEMQEMQKEYWSVSSQHAFIAYVLSLKGMKVQFQAQPDAKQKGALIERLFDGRDKLELYGKSLLALTLHNLKDERGKLVLQNMKQYVEENNETQLAWFRTPQQGWWHWWNNDIETNAWALKALTKIEPKSDISPRLVKWLLNNRKNGYYWRSTRDTTMVLSAMSDYVVASGEGNADYKLTIELNGVKKEVKIDKNNFFTFDNKFIMEGAALGAGKHTLKITKEGPGALYYNSYLSYFTKERNIAPAGLELKVDRKYFKLQQIDYTVDVEDSEGKIVKEKRLRYERVPLKDGDTVKSGDLIQVELKVTTDNNYTYLALEDMKPAGCEPVKLTSGGEGQEGFYSYMEMRDEKVVLFVANIDQGEHLLRYRLRAEIPGVFHALPTKFYAIYVPELKANSAEHVMKIID